MRENTNPKKKMTRNHSSPFPGCFRPTTVEYPHTPRPSTPNLTTCLYQTPLGLFSLTWSHSFFSRSFHLHLHSSPSSSPSSLHLSLKPLFFWSKHGFKLLPSSSPSKSIWVFWDLTQAKFGSGPEPTSGFYIAVVSDGKTILLVGDLENEAYLKTKAKRMSQSQFQSFVVRREHVFGDRFFTTRTEFGGKSRLISIELNTGCGVEGPRLVIRFDSKRVLQVKHLKWKFRGSERIEVDGHPIQLSWDVHNWLFEEDCGNNNQGDEGCALFTFRFEKQGKEEKEVFNGGVMMMGSQDSCGLNYERKKMKKKLSVKTRSCSSSSLSSASSGTSSVLEWESVEENQLKGPTGFSLLLYAWKS